MTGQAARGQTARDYGYKPKITDIPLLRQSERAAFKRCNWAWWQGYVNPILGGQGITPIVEHADAADFGTLVHMALATYYKPGTKRGPHPAETFDTLAKDKVANIKTVEYTNDEQVVKWEDFHELGIILMEEYVSHYQGDPHWDVLDAERRFDVIVPDVRYKPMLSEKGRRGFRPIVNLVGTFDLVFRDLNDDQVKMVDHKTCTSIQTHHLTLDEQASTYIAVATTALRHQGLIGPNESVKGIEYNFIRKSKPWKEPLKQAYVDALVYNGELEVVVKKRLKTELADMCELMGIQVQGEPVDKPLFERFFVPRTAKERQRQIVRISEEARVMDMVRTGQLPILKTPQRDCVWCKYFDLCELDESGGDTEYFIENTYKKADPYFDHRDGAINSKKVDHGSKD